MYVKSIKHAQKIAIITYNSAPENTKITGDPRESEPHYRGRAHVYIYIYIYTAVERVHSSGKRAYNFPQIFLARIIRNSKVKIEIFALHFSLDHLSA